MDREPVEISVTRAPHPTTLRYTLSREELVTVHRLFKTPAEAAGASPLAEQLFAVAPVQRVVFGPGFVSVTYANFDDIRAVNDRVLAVIKEALEAGSELCLPAPASTAPEDPVTAKIHQVIEAEIRPLLAQDGGDIVFMRFEDGTAYVYLQGACSCCPHAAQTLKMGVEARLREQVPEVLAVEALA